MLFVHVIHFLVGGLVRTSWGKVLVAARTLLRVCPIEPGKRLRPEH